ncbi:MAG: hypothetical protein V3T83_09290 [Acidobacteriota bacterium]
MGKAQETHLAIDKGRASDLVFFLGGRDLEMETIRDLLEEHAPGRFFDKGLGWGAKASDYRGQMSAALERGCQPVLVELDIDLALDLDRVVIIDHHGRQAGSEKETSLEQVFQLLDLPPERWTRWHLLVAENDRGYIPALRKAGASTEEIVELRNRDRRAQGVTEDEERAAKKAASQAEHDPDGGLTVVRLPHSRTSPLTDFLDPAFGGPGYQNLLVISPGEVNFYGSGELVRRLNEQIPGGWRGGSLPHRGFWGRTAAPTLEIERIAKKALQTAKDYIDTRKPRILWASGVRICSSARTGSPTEQRPARCRRSRSTPPLVSNQFVRIRSSEISSIGARPRGAMNCGGSSPAESSRSARRLLTWPFCRRSADDAEVGAGAARGPVAASATFTPAAPSANKRPGSGVGRKGFRVG